MPAPSAAFTPAPTAALEEGVQAFTGVQEENPAPSHAGPVEKSFTPWPSPKGSDGTEAGEEEGGAKGGGILPGLGLLKRVFASALNREASFKGAEAPEGGRK